jgi:hypothetical protein
LEDLRNVAHLMLICSLKLKELESADIHLYTVKYTYSTVEYSRSVEERVRRNNLYTFGVFEIRLTPQWECTVVQRASPFILIAFAHRSVPSGCPAEIRTGDHP